MAEIEPEALKIAVQLGIIPNSQASYYLVSAGLATPFGAHSWLLDKDILNPGQRWSPLETKAFERWHAKYGTAGNQTNI